jgi:redox-sensitive bicupin YhaK (pirin superfamily)
MPVQTDLKLRSVADSIAAQRTTEGGGVTVRRAFPTHRLDEVDPFLLFDHMGPWTLNPGQSTGFPDHPHRGFETVTYLLQGQMEHRDSFGNRGVIKPGGVQWMTAGSGLVHSEMPGAELVRTGGKLEGFQIWVNLPKSAKMTPPHYQELDAAQIPVASAEGVTARVIAGESLGVKGAVQTSTPIEYLHFTLAPGASHVQQVPRSHNAVAYVISGTARFEGRPEADAEGRMVVFAHDGDHVGFSNPGGGPVDILLLAGEPLGEPVARYGPFVMNTREELIQAFEDFRTGKMGTIE